MTIHVIEVQNAEGEELSVTMRGEAAEIVKVLVGGLPREALIQIRDALVDEIEKRRDEA